MNRSECVRQDDEAAGRPLCQVADRLLDVGIVANSPRDRRDGEGGSGGFERTNVVAGLRRRLRVEHRGDAGDAGRHLLEQLDPFAAQRRLDIDEAGDVAARTRQALNETAADRIGDHHEYDGDGARRAEERCHDRRGAGENDVRPQLHQLLGQPLHPGGFAGSPAIDDVDIAARQPSGLRESPLECHRAGRRFRIRFGAPHHDGNARHRARLLCARAERPRRRAAEQPNERAPSHGIAPQMDGDDSRAGWRCPQGGPELISSRGGRLLRGAAAGPAQQLNGARLSWRPFGARPGAASGSFRHRASADWTARSLACARALTRGSARARNCPGDCSSSASPG